MPEDMSCALIKILDILEDRNFDTPIVRSQKYKSIQNILDSDTPLSVPIIERVLAVCAHNMKDDKKYCGNGLAIISSIVKRIKAAQYTNVPDLLPSALEIMRVMKTTAQLSKAEALQVLCFDTLLSYPDETLISVATSHTTELIELFHLYSHQRIPTEIRLLPCGILAKLLKILPPEKRLIFVKDNLMVWFVKLIPAILSSELQGLNYLKHFEALELLAEELQNFDYSDNPHWEALIACIYNPKKYPLIMMSLLEAGNPYWHRLWIVFIKLLKKQIVRGNTQVSPINALLPIVEVAFKMDVQNRCRAFKCWEALIDNFHKETNEAYIAKRLKLLLIPLHSNNAKVEETAIAKLNTWWHLIRIFQTRMDKFLDIAFIPFLNFCFGKNISTPKNTFVPGMISNKSKKLCVEAFVDVAGHLDCPGCGSLPRLNGKFMKTQLLVCYWNNFANCLRKCIIIATDDGVGVTLHQAQCLWKSFVLTIGELPENNIRRDIFNELLSVLENLTQDTDQCTTDNVDKNKLADLILNLIFSMFANENNKIMALLTTLNENNGPMYKILSIILGPISNNLYNKNDSIGCINKAKTVTNYITNGNMCAVSHLVDWLLRNLSPNNNTLVMWTALVQSVHENVKPDSLNLNSILLWPLQNINKFTEPGMASSAWYNLYTFAYTNNNTVIDEEISELVQSMTITEENKVFALNVSLAVLKLKLIRNDENNIQEDILMMMNAISKVEDYKSIENTLLVIVDTLNLLTSKLADISNDIASEYSVVTTLKLLTLVNQQSPDTVIDLGHFIEQLHKNIEVFVKKSNSLELQRKIIVELTKYAKGMKGKDIKELLRLLNSCLSVIKDDKYENAYFYSTIKNTIDDLDPKNVGKAYNTKLQNDKNNFTSPNTSITPKVITRKAKKREASIVNTVVENGEEYVVVKSNWKYNPRKFTENQKEKLQRKREDIPALYQDLSQSQDEFKMATWKADSQDTSTTNSSKSNSKTSDEPLTILKFMPCSDVVPKIIENIFSESTPKVDVVKEKSVDDTSKTMKPRDIKDVKSPRVALKDRVFRNVKSLIEKSSLPSNGKDMSESPIQIKNVPETPVSKELNIANMTNSAPPQINAERLSRVKRKPKKFDDAVLFGLKKRRNSSAQSLGDAELSQTQLEDHVCTLSGDAISTEPTSNIETVPSNKDLPVSNVETKTENVETDLKEADHSPQKPVNDDAVAKKLPEEKVILSQNDHEIQIDSAKENNVEKDVINENVEGKDKEDTSFEISKKDKKISTPKAIKKKDSQESSVKKSAKKSRIESQLAIDMVEGHPFLKANPVKRLTRKNLNSANNNKRITSSEKMNKSKSDAKTPVKQDKKKEKCKDEPENNRSKDEATSPQTKETKQDRSFDSIEDAPCSEDIIESSQDSTVTTISVKSAKPVLKKVSVVLENVHSLNKRTKKASETHTQNLLDADSQNISFNDKVEESKEDIEISKNKTVEDIHHEDLTETMDTEPFDSNVVDEIVVISDHIPIISLDTDHSVVGSETQALAEADTLPNSAEELVEIQMNKTTTVSIKTIVDSALVKSVEAKVDLKEKNQIKLDIDNKTDVTIAETIDISSPDKDNDASSPFRDDVQRKQDFLDNTLEISPIKTMSPVKDKNSPSPETSSDYVLIKLSSPVQSNGEPFEKCDSPEIFTEEKISPDKRDLSPPREEISVTNTNTSPSSSLSLKKNRPQVRAGGRAAQMLGLCVPDRLQNLINSERSDAEEPKRSSPTTPARRNLRILINSVSDSNETSEENDESGDNLLKFKRSLPTADSSPSVPILKRKLAEITDEATVSPASKRKRVSFHDPPVSTTISVQKYIEPCGIRSPQNSALKRQERQLRSQTNMKSPKRLDTAFKLDTVLNKAAVSFDDTEKNISVDDTQMTSLDETPVAEIVKTSDLNDTDPICPDLLDCTDPIDAIASELSSPATKIMFLKELEGKIVMIGDLAKMTELEVNRLCIKAPKVKIAKKVLSDYASKRVVKEKELEKQIIEEIKEVQEPVKEIVPEIQWSDAEMQTNSVVCMDVEVQTNVASFESAAMQTNEVPRVHSHTQTKESGSNSTAYVITSCLSERPDFVDKLNVKLPETSKQQIADSLPFDSFANSFIKKVTHDNAPSVINRVLKQIVTNPSESDQTEISLLRNYLYERYEPRDLILLCSDLLRKVHDRTA